MPTGKKKTICLNMIVKNEAHIIADTLEHLDKYIKFDYWVISDTGSTDATKEIIKDFYRKKGIPGELVEHAWKDFGYNRSAACAAAYKKSDYIFVWDADDEISGNFVMPADLTADSYKFTFGNESGFRYNRCQLFNNRLKWCYKGVLHEYADCLEPSKPAEPVLGDYYFVSGRRGDRSKDPNKYLKDALVLEKGFAEAFEAKDHLYNRYAFYCAQSYNSCNMYEKSIEWYKKALTLNLWIQERYICCLEIYDMYEKRKMAEEGLRYLVESYKYDSTRVECIYRLIKHYCIHGPCEVAYAYYTLIQDFYENRYLKEEGVLSEKLFAKKDEYDFYFPYYMIIVSERTKHLDTAAKMYAMIFRLNYLHASEWWIRNLIHNMQFCIEAFPKDLGFLNSMLLYLENLFKKGVALEDSHHAVVEKVIHSFRPLLTAESPLAKTLVNRPSKPRLMLTITSCKRLDLFTKTVNSILNTWTDIDKIDYFFCVDDNSTQRDRSAMTRAYPFIDFYMKRQKEKGHRESMNIIYKKLDELKPTYWIHLEDDWLFFKRDSYVEKAATFLDRHLGDQIHQILYNRNYAETYDGWTINGATPLEAGFSLHQKSDSIPGRNCGYWPHYSFRPSMIRVEAILGLGNYDSANTFFERDYADRYYAKGYKSAFYDTVCSLHIGKLTSDKTGANAYVLNKVGQFNTNDLTKKNQNTFVINLLRRTDRKEAVEILFDKEQITDYEFYEAVDGKELVVTDEITTLFLGNDFGSRKGVIGCALSHYNLWKQLIDDPTNEYYTIFEDDITLCDGFNTKYNSHLDSIQKSDEYDMIFLGYHVRDQHKNEQIVTIPGKNSIPLNMSIYIGGFYSYSITKAGAKKLIEYINKHGINHGIDYLVKIIPGFKAVNLQPHIVFSDWVKSSSSPVDTDIQKDWTSLKLTLKTINKDDWTFYKGLDCGGYDIRFINGKSSEELEAIASKSPGCIAFNTLGFLKSNVKFPLIQSPYYRSSEDGIFINTGWMNTRRVSSVRVKMLCNWCSSEDLCKEWLKMTKGSYKWNAIQITWEDTDIDYYVIVNKPQPGAHFVPEKTIVFHMEPWCGESWQTWGVKTWGEWAKPDPSKFLQVRSHDKYFNTGFWQLNMSYTDLKNPIEKKESLGNTVSSICSSKYFDPGHKFRIDFMKYIETKADPSVTLHVYNEDNQHGFQKSYVGKAQPSVDKEKGILPYKYYFMCENNAEVNFITEKLWEPILCETLCFYWGCPNVADYIDPMAYLQLDMNDFEGSFQIVKAAIESDLWSQRLPAIRNAKEKVLEYYGFFPTLERVLQRTDSVQLGLRSHSKVCFIHSCNLEVSGTEKLDLLLESICKSELLGELDAILINTIGLPLDLSKYSAISKKIEVIQHSSDPTLFEIPTLTLIQRYSKLNPGVKVLYLHTKGIMYSKTDSRYPNVLDWIHYMLYFLVDSVNYTKCLDLLDSYDTVGCNYLEAPNPHYSGNFWWSTTDYLKTVSTDSLSDKMSAEWWLLSGSPRIHVLYSSGINHFLEAYPSDKYRATVGFLI